MIALLVAAIHSCLAVGADFNSSFFLSNSSNTINGTSNIFNGTSNNSNDTSNTLNGTSNGTSKTSNDTANTFNGTLKFPVDADSSFVEKYQNLEMIDGALEVKNTKNLKRLSLPALKTIICKQYPCILVRQNANLRALWLPKLKEIIYGNVTGKFVMYLEGDKLELTMQDIATLRFLTGDHLRVVNPVNSDYGRTKPYYSGDPPAEYLYADEVLPFVVGALICWVLITLVVSIIFLVKRINLNSMESAVMEEMVKIRAISIQAKLSRYEIEDYQRKNPTKTFTEAANAVAKNSSEQSQKPATSNVRKSRAILLDAVSAGKKAN